MSETWPPTYYAVAFTSLRSSADAQGYARMSERMVELARQQPGYLGHESARGEDGLGITISYWRDLESIRRWREHPEHRVAQELGRSRWYADYRLRICRVESESGGDGPLRTKA